MAETPHNKKYFTEEARREAARQACRKHRAKNLEKLKEQQKIAKRKWRESNREEDRRRVREWQLKYPEKCRALKARYKHSKKRSTPPWVDMDAIDAIYEACPPGYHVDHIEPLKGKDICGLHVPWNLQYLKAEDNLRKGNRRVKS